MSEKIGRNDPCPCGSGKKYKQCCLSKQKPASQRKISAVWVNKPKEKEQDPAEERKQEISNYEAMERKLIERTFGSAIETAEKEGAPSLSDRNIESQEGNP